MEQFSSLDLHYLTKEIQFLNTNRIENFYYDNNYLYIKIYVKTKGNYFLKTSLGNYLYLETTKNFQSQNNNFVNFLRKHLKNSFIEKIENIENERILKLQISKKQNETLKTYYLIIELFKPGNIILCNQKLQIINSLLKKNFKDRIVKNKQTYQLPPAKQQTLQKTTLNTNKIVTTLAKEIGLGGKYSKETLNKSQINQTKTSNELNAKEITQINQELKNLKNLKLEPQIYTQNNKITNYSPFPLKHLETSTTQTQTNKHFYETLKQYYSQFETKTNPKQKEYENKIQKLKNRLQKLENQKKQVQKDSEKHQQTGDKIYENYATLETLLTKIKQLKQKTQTNIPKEYKQIIHKINPKTKTITLKKNKKN